MVIHSAAEKGARNTRTAACARAQVRTLCLVCRYMLDSYMCFGPDAVSAVTQHDAACQSNSQRQTGNGRGMSIALRTQHVNFLTQPERDPEGCLSSKAGMRGAGQLSSHIQAPDWNTSHATASQRSGSQRDRHCWAKHGAAPMHDKLSEWPTPDCSSDSFVSSCRPTLKTDTV